MSKNELVVTYRPGPGWLVGLFCLLGTVSLLLLLARTALLVMNFQLTAVFEGLLFFCCGPFLCFYLAYLLKEDKIIMRKEGIIFPLHLLLQLRTRLWRKWTDIGAIALESEEPDFSKDQQSEVRWMVFHFGSGGHARVCLSDLSIGALDTMFKASKRWGSTAVMAPELIELRRKLLSGPTVAERASLTAMWEDELRSQFTATNFVPLQAGAALQRGKFRILSQIAAGGLSAIYLAKTADNKQVVLKEMVVPATADEATLEKAKLMFEREGKFLIKLHHPRIAKIYDHFVEAGRDYLVLQYIPGQSLRQYVALEGPRPEETVIEWCAVIAGILDYLHKQDPPIIHRDVSPDNIVLSNDGKLYIIDFGAANEFIGTATGTLVGKQAYMAPEQFRGRAVPASDLYSLGATAYFLLTGKDPEALTAARPRGVVSVVSLQMDDFVAEMTAGDVQKRISSCESVQARLSQLEHTDRTSVINIQRGAK